MEPSQDHPLSLVVPPSSGQSEAEALKAEVRHLRRQVEKLADENVQLLKTIAALQIIQRKQKPR